MRTQIDGFESCIADRGPARAAILLSEPFGIENPRTIEEATFASLCLDVFSHAIDDIADDPTSDKTLLAHIGSLLLATAAQVYAQIIGDDTTFWDCWHRYLKQSSEAELYLQQCPEDLDDLDLNHLAMLGKKSSLVNMSAALYASLSDRWHLLEQLEQGLSAAATGIQLIDDLVDWREDSKSGVWTYPIALARRHSNSGTLQQAISSGSLIIEVLDLAQTKLEEGRLHFESVEAYSMIQFIDSLITRVRKAKNYPIPVTEPETTPVIPYTEDLRWIIGPKLGH